MSHEESAFEDEIDEESGNQTWLSESLSGEARNLSVNSEVVIEKPTEQEVKEAGEWWCQGKWRAFFLEACILLQRMHLPGL